MSKDPSKEPSDPPASSTALVVAGGDRPDPKTVQLLPAPVFVIAADSGVDHARSLGLLVDAVVGDLDSASPDGVEWARDNGAEIETHPSDKDQTDLELALAKAAQWAEDGHRSADDERDNSKTSWTVGELIVLGLDGGRFDHWLANILTLGGPHCTSVPVTAYFGACRATVVRHSRTLWGRPGEVVTLLAVGGDAKGVTTVGLIYPLDGEQLDSGSARGVSNMFAAGSVRKAGTGDKQFWSPDSGGHPLGQGYDDTSRGVDGEYGGMVSATVTVKTGTVLALQPHALSGPGPVHPPTSTPRDD